MIYHYASLESFKAIVESQSLWASDSRYLNDYREIEDARSSIIRIKDLILMRTEEEMKIHVDTALIMLEKEIINVFICSFSRNPDKLSQWRGYASDARGVCLGFDENILRVNGINLYNVTYGEEIVQRCMLFAQRIEKSGENVGAKMLNKLIEIAVTSKNPAFAEEQEIRLVVFPYQVVQGGIKFRLRLNYIIPYVVVNLGSIWQQSLKEVWIGPAQTDPPVRQSIRDFLDKTGLRSVRIKASRATFRN